MQKSLLCFLLECRCYHIQHLLLFRHCRPTWVLELLRRDLVQHAAVFPARAPLSSHPPLLCLYCHCAPTWVLKLLRRDLVQPAQMQALTHT
jgi:cAMP phosphodiesterase